MLKKQIIAKIQKLGMSEVRARCAMLSFANGLPFPLSVIKTLSVKWMICDGDAGLKFTYTRVDEETEGRITEAVFVPKENYHNN